METIKLNYKDALICDPGYIKNVQFGGEPRFDALRCDKVLFEGDDGCYTIETSENRYLLGVDSGRIWVMTAEFGCEVELDAGLSGYIVLKANTPEWGNDIEVVEE